MTPDAPSLDEIRNAVDVVVAPRGTSKRARVEEVRDDETIMVRYVNSGPDGSALIGHLKERVERDDVVRVI